ncbi:MAG: hypothetical protein JNL08_17830 [Planctomycetes bacterium]|nr:hypothetical protein [Planctomycetota bacterium]
MNRSRRLVPSCLVLFAACATSAHGAPAEHALESELRELQQIQQVFREQNTAPIEFDFPADGRVTVREVSLDGWPGGEYVRCRFHYQNRTDKPVVQAWVWLDVLSADGHLVSTQACNCIIPVPIPIARGSYYSDELRTPTYGAHLQPGWSWRIRCSAVLETADEPLDPPVPPRTVREFPPMQIQPR